MFFLVTSVHTCFVCLFLILQELLPVLVNLSFYTTYLTLKAGSMFSSRKTRWNEAILTNYLLYLLFNQQGLLQQKGTIHGWSQGNTL